MVLLLYLTPDKLEMVDASNKDRWVAKYMGSVLDVRLQEGGLEAPPLNMIRIEIEITGMRFDSMDRLWLSCSEGYIEILDMKRSAKKLAPVRYVLTKLADRTIQSSPRLTKWPAR